MRAERQNLIPLVEGYGDNEQGHLVLQVTDVLMSLGAVDGKHFHFFLASWREWPAQKWVHN